jgi:hypothetical protein
VQATRGSCRSLPGCTRASSLGGIKLAGRSGDRRRGLRRGRRLVRGAGGCLAVKGQLAWSWSSKTTGIAGLVRSLGLAAPQLPGRGAGWPACLRTGWPRLPGTGKRARGTRCCHLAGCSAVRVSRQGNGPRRCPDRDAARGRQADPGCFSALWVRSVAEMLPCDHFQRRWRNEWQKTRSA